MRWFVVALVCVATLLNGGCAIIDSELHNRGGYLDHLADKYWFKADSKKMRALRAFALEASLARIASVSPKGSEDRQLMALRVRKASERAERVLVCAFKENLVGPNDPRPDPCFYFDSLMVDYTTALFDLAMIAFPIEDTKNLVNLVAGGFTGPLAAGDLLSSLVEIARDALKYGRIIGAIYRDTMELEVQVWLSTPYQTPNPMGITEAVVAPLGAVYELGNDNMRSWETEIDALRAHGLEPIPDPAFIGEIAGLISYMCTQIDSASVDQCAYKWTVPALQALVEAAPKHGSNRALWSAILKNQRRSLLSRAKS